MAMRAIGILGLCGVLIGAQVTPVNISPANAALPPLSKETLLKSSTHIVVAKVREISKTQEVPIRLNATYAGTNYIYTVTVEVLKVEKNPSSQSSRNSASLSPGKVIQVHYWQAGKRPTGWAGPGGQRPGLQPKTKVRLYLAQDAQGKFNLLEPNGSESVKFN
jgi:hypothetical protein